LENILDTIESICGYIHKCVDPEKYDASEYVAAVVDI
jgi:hypothetical protein